MVVVLIVGVWGGGLLIGEGGEVVVGARQHGSRGEQLGMASGAAMKDGAGTKPHVCVPSVLHTVCRHTACIACRHNHCVSVVGKTPIAVATDPT